MNGVEVTVCPPHDAPRALHTLFASLPSAQRQSMVTSLSESLEHDPASQKGLLIARDQDGLCGAVFAQEHPGKTAVLWPPSATADDRHVRRKLAEAVDLHLVHRGVVMAQALLPTRDDPAVEMLESIGFTYLTHLDYMIGQTQSAPWEQPSDGLRFEPYDAYQRSRMTTLVDATYVDTSDCPELNGVREPDDVLAGYQSTGAFDPAKWFIASHGGRDVGVLLLTEHAEARQWELVYMALVPQARRKGFGMQMVRFALAKAYAAGIATLLLAVDARNQPGIRLYEKCGFRVWDRRVVYWKRYKFKAPQISGVSRLFPGAGAHGLGGATPS